MRSRLKTLNAELPTDDELVEQLFRPEAVHLAGFRVCHSSRHPHIWNINQGWPKAYHGFGASKDETKARLIENADEETCPQHTRKKKK